MKKCVFYFITYFVVCFGGLGSLYRLVSLLMGESAFAWMPRRKRGLSPQEKRIMLL